jgi:hypothetical protein
MSRLTLDLPESLHKALKSFAVLNGGNMRNVAITALEKYMHGFLQEVEKKHNNAFAVGKKLQAQFENNEITGDEFNEKFNKIVSYLTEEEEDEILMPYLLKIVEDIETGKEKTYSWEEVKAKLNDC